MLASSLLIFTSAALALASPVEYHGRCSGCEYGKPVPVLPVNGGPSELPAPPRDVTLKHIALGFGIQNYSCAEAGATPAAIGALAVLYDVTSLYPEMGSLPSDVLNTRKVPLTAMMTVVPRSLILSPRNNLSRLKVSAKHPYLGRHFFNAAGDPAFDLDKANQLLIAKKIDGTSAVDWLYLGDAGGSQVSPCYRVLTAGGASQGCKAKAPTAPLTRSLLVYG
ncbi:uncharacterized protein BKA55DRAFT_599067 [Fusarium redolens]|uniref:Malate dehydrogenase n=1 Tax=Fusarium redolens TaxID=48865 RepID=A0A9P9G0A0_FUSRE|nr:uncharacterized protein BKA55DRAFT_599067 [Fusarium redolens]KAH7228540.1 hypothetical protein BKA55DRAFT_599067 [Fusarium redolens]